jgi:hypothetical protein
LGDLQAAMANNRLKNKDLNNGQKRDKLGMVAEIAGKTPSVANLSETI